MKASCLWFGIPDRTNNQKIEIISEYAKTLLLNSNWTQSSDSGLSILERSIWKDYRDNLRSIRDSFENPDDVTFPEPPVISIPNIQIGGQK